jgi:hypothetical protein
MFRNRLSCRRLWVEEDNDRPGQQTTQPWDCPTPRSRAHRHGGGAGAGSRQPGVHGLQPVLPVLAAGLRDPRHPQAHGAARTTIGRGALHSRGRLPPGLHVRSHELPAAPGPPPPARGREHRLAGPAAPPAASRPPVGCRRDRDPRREQDREQLRRLPGWSGPGGDGRLRGRSQEGHDHRRRCRSRHLCLLGRGRGPGPGGLGRGQPGARHPRRHRGQDPRGGRQQPAAHPDRNGDHGRSRGQALVRERRG